MLPAAWSSSPLNVASSRGDACVGAACGGLELFLRSQSCLPEKILSFHLFLLVELLEVRHLSEMRSLFQERLHLPCTDKTCVDRCGRHGVSHYNRICGTGGVVGE